MRILFLLVKVMKNQHFCMKIYRIFIFNVFLMHYNA